MGKQKETKRRSIDKAVQENFAWMKNKIVLMNKKNVKAWHGVAFFAFLVGIIISITWMARFDTRVSSQASNNNSLATSDELRQIKDKIKEKKAKWTAGETEISKLSPEERKKRVAKELKTTFPDAKEITPPIVSLAPTLDWRNNNGNFITPVKNQGGCGSCWAFATTANTESAVLLKNNTPYSQNPVDLSEQVMVSCSGAGSCSGGYMDPSYVVNTGLPAESCYPYTATNGNCSSACANWQASASKISDYKVINTSDVNTVKNAIATYGPLTAGMDVYSDFFSYLSGVYSYVTGTYQGGHAIQLVGYDDSTQSFILKNSWGTGWGEAGFFKVAYSQLTSSPRILYSTFYAFNTTNPVNPPQPDTTNPTVSITSPANGSIVSGNVDIGASASDNVGISKVEFYVNSNLVNTDTSAPYSYSWNTASVANGSVALSAIAYDTANNKGSSAMVNVTVNNVSDTSNPTVTITSPVQGFKLPARGIVTVSATATDDVGIAKIELLVDNNLKTTCNQAKCSYSLNATSLKKGTHTISAKAYDLSGKTGSNSISVTK